MRMFNILCIFLLTFILQNCGYSSNTADGLIGKSNRQSTTSKSPRRAPVGNIINQSREQVNSEVTEQSNPDIKRSSKDYDAYQHYQSANPPKKAKRHPLLNIHELNEIMDKEATIVTVETSSEKTLHIEADTNLKKVIDHNKAKKAKEKKHKKEISKKEVKKTTKKPKKKAKILVITKEIIPQSNATNSTKKQQTTATAAKPKAKSALPAAINSASSNAIPVISSAASIQVNSPKSPVQPNLVTAPVLQTATTSTNLSKAVDTIKLPPIDSSKALVKSALVTTPIKKTPNSSNEINTTMLPPVSLPEETLITSTAVSEPTTLIVETSTKSSEIVDVIELPSVNSPEILIEPTVTISPDAKTANPAKSKIAPIVDKNKNSSKKDNTDIKSKIAAPTPALNMPKIDIDNMTQEDIEQVLKNKFTSKKKKGALDQAISDIETAPSTTPAKKKKPVPLPALPISMSNITESLNVSKITNLNDLLIEYYFKLKYLLLNVFSFG